jgi:hypothetical protein
MQHDFPMEFDNLKQTTKNKKLPKLYRCLCYKDRIQKNHSGADPTSPKLSGSDQIRIRSTARNLEGCFKYGEFF